jgi:hypothetical protein
VGQDHRFPTQRRHAPPSQLQGRGQVPPESRHRLMCQRQDLEKGPFRPGRHSRPLRPRTSQTQPLEVQSRQDEPAHLPHQARNCHASLLRHQPTCPMSTQAQASRAESRRPSQLAARPFDAAESTADPHRPIVQAKFSLAASFTPNTRARSASRGERWVCHVTHHPKWFQFGMIGAAGRCATSEPCRGRTARRRPSRRSPPARSGRTAPPSPSRWCR